MTTPKPKPGTGGQRGARPVGGPDDGARKKPWWLLALLAVVAIIALILLLSRCGTSSDTAATSPATSTTSAAASTTSGASSSSSSASASVATTSAPAAGAPAAGSSSPLTANGTALLPLATAAPTGTPTGTLTAYVGQTATSASTPVQAVPDVEDGLWVGTSPTDRVWVVLIDDAEPPYDIALGDKVNFTGKLVPNPPNFAASIGLTDADGAAQLTAQAAHIEVAETGVTLAP